VQELEGLVGEGECGEDQCAEAEWVGEEDFV
jgi:hypothetical protein